MKLHELFEEEERSILSVKGKQPDRYDGDFNCAGQKLTSLEGAPRIVTGSFYCQNNYLKNLDHVPESMNYLNALNDGLTSLHNIHKKIKHCSIANFAGNPITSHVLGLLLIDGLRIAYLDTTKIGRIINKHLANGRDIFACQEELIDAGFDEYAQL